MMTALALLSFYIIYFVDHKFFFIRYLIFNYKFYATKRLVALLLFQLVLSSVCLALVLSANKVLAHFFIFIFAFNYAVELAFISILHRPMEDVDALNANLSWRMLFNGARSFLRLQHIFYFMIYLAVLAAIRYGAELRVDLVTSLYCVILLTIMLVFMGTKGRAFTFSSHMVKGIFYMLKGAFVVPQRKDRVSASIYPLDPAATAQKNIILVIDESIRGDMLSLNGYSEQTTPFLDSIKYKLKNYGVITASHSYSHYAVMSLSTNTDPASLTSDQSMNAVTLFQLAKRAGYQTTFIDFLGTIRDGYAPSDMDFVDHKLFLNVSHPQASYSERDFIAVDEIKKLIVERAEKNQAYHFILVIKYGSHFPYSECYPKSFKRFSPEMKPTDNLYSDPTRILGSYLNSVSYNVDEYWKKIADIPSHDSLWIYTSDHGQKVPPNKGEPTHGTNHPDMLKVPLWLYSERLEDFRKHFEVSNYQPQTKNLSHYDTFTFISLLMGYDLKRKIPLSE